MELSFHAAIAEGYKNGTQRAKNLSEHWVRRNCYCPSCGHDRLDQTPANSPAQDFVCLSCNENFELKCQYRLFGRKIVDGAYGAMMTRLRSSRNPNLLLLHYDRDQLCVRNLILVPKYFFIPDMIIAKKPLAAHARRAGWVGCNIVLEGVPETGRIHLVKDQAIIPRDAVVSKWKSTHFLADQRNMEARGWLLALIRCVEKIGRREFSIEDVYQFEQELQAEYPHNHNIKAKIRQRLQVLRDKNYLVFLGGGMYRTS